MHSNVNSCLAVRGNILFRDFSCHSYILVVLFFILLNLFHVRSQCDLQRLMAASDLHIIHKLKKSNHTARQI